MSKVRLQFDFTSEAVDGLDEIKERLGAGSRAEVIRRALRLLDYATNDDNKGRTLVLRDADGNAETLFVL